MMAELLYGKQLAESIINTASKQRENLRHRAPHLVIVDAGSGSSDSYCRSISKVLSKLDCNISQMKIFDKDGITESLIQRLNDDRNIDGVIFMRPYGDKAYNLIRTTLDPVIDVDGITTTSSAIWSGQGGWNNTVTSGYLPCTAEAIISLLKEHNVGFEGRHFVIVGRSDTVGKPVAMLALQENATVTICHSYTVGLKEICQTADVLISAVGKPKFITNEHIKVGATVIDAGINVDENGKLCGDCDIYSGEDSVIRRITPVPGGVGPVTTAILAHHLIIAAYRRYNRKSSHL